MIRSAVLEHDVCYLMSRRMDREYLTYQRPPIACHSMCLGEGITFMNHAPSGGVASSSTTPASIKRARGIDVQVAVSLAGALSVPLILGTGRSLGAEPVP